MGVHTLSGILDGTREAAVMVDSVSGYSFGPTFDSASDVDSFLEFAKCAGVRDVRELNDGELDELHVRWLVQRLRDEAATC